MFFEWMFFLSVATLLVLWGISKLADRARWGEAWVVNTVGGVTACCLRKDFVRSTMVTRGRVIVPKTIVFSTKTPPTKGCWLLSENPEHAGIFQWNSREDPSLFIPFLSERDLSFEMQRQMFLQEPQRVRFERMHRAELRRQDLLALDNSDAFTITGIASATIMVLCLCIIGVQWSAGNEEKRLQSPASFFTTTEASAVEHRDTLSAIRQLPVGDQVFMELNALDRGMATEIFPVGGGMSAVCYRRMDQMRVCGISADALGVRIGDLVYFRYGSLRHHIDPSGRVIENTFVWVISGKEAYALEERGYSFRQ